jgi:VCBS repeat protein/thrombospondin type 3 repeat protein
MPERARRPAEKRTARLFLHVAILTLCVGTLATAALFAPRPGTIDRSVAMLAADFDRDGFQDLAIANFEAGTISILLNQRDGTFAPQANSPSFVGPATFSSPTNGPLAMAVGELNPGDVDGDGVLNGVDNCPNVYNPPDAVTGKQADSDSDGIGDACALLGTDSLGNPVMLDSDGDGIADFDPTSHSLDNCPLTYNPTQLDSNNDKVGDACPTSPDLVVLGTSLGAGSTLGIIRTRVNDGAGGLVALFSKVGGAGAADILLADFNNDGALDMIASNSQSNNLQLFNGAMDGTFGPQQLLASSGGPEGLAAGDFNGDFGCDLGASSNLNRCDVAVANRDADTISLYLNTGSGLPLQPNLVLPPTSGHLPTTLLAGFLNNDAISDLVALEQGGSGDGMVEVFVGSASGPMTSVQQIDLGIGHVPFRGVLADLNKDGVLDLAVTDFSFGQLLLFKGNGDGTFTLMKTLGGMVNPAAVVSFDYDPDDAAGPDPDLAVLDFATNRVELFKYGPALDFVPAPTSPVTPWMDRPSVPQAETADMTLYGADRDTGLDIVLLHRTPPRLDVLSGIGTGFFRLTPPIPLKGLAEGSSFIVGDLREDNFFDLAVLDQVGSTLTVVTGDPSTLPVERGTVAIPGGPPASAVIGPLILGSTDYDRDGVSDFLDDCPTLYNPPGCTGTCGAPPALCNDPVLTPTDCGLTDPRTGQCDSDGNGIGDACQLLNSTCAILDSDGDLKPDYDSGAISLIAPGLPDFDRDTVPNASDNCPTVFNLPDANGNQDPSACQSIGDTDGDGVLDFDPISGLHDNCPLVYNPGQEDNDNDGVGNACVLAAALDNCPWTKNLSQADTGLNGTLAVGTRGNNVGDACDFPANDIAVVSPASGTVSLLSGDSSGSFRAGSLTPITGLANPSSAVIAPLSLQCDPVSGGACITRPTTDILVAERHAQPNPSDDDLRLFHGTGSGLFTNFGSTAARGDPNDLQEIDAQRVCPDPEGPVPGTHFDSSGRSNLVVAAEPGTSSLEVFLPGTGGMTIPPAGQPLPVPGTLVDFFHFDLNFDGIQDLVVLSTDVGSPPASNVTVYMGMGNGLFFTDPSLNVTGLKNGATKIAGGFIDIAASTSLPDVAIFSGADAEPFILLNVLAERADVDGSKRVDGFDLALLARAFGSTRGEDFTVRPSDGTLIQSGSGYSSLVVGSGASVLGQDICHPADPTQANSICVCNGRLDPLTGFYGLPVDINLDGQVDGTDLALLASLFGRSL